MRDYCIHFKFEGSPGTMFHTVPRPTEDYYCQDTEGWQNLWVLNPYNKKCYLFGRNDPEDGSSLWVNFTAADSFCQKQNKNGGSQPRLLKYTGIYKITI